MMFICLHFLVFFIMSRLAQEFLVNPNRTYPTSCCSSDITDQISIAHKSPSASAVVDDSFREQQHNFTNIADLAWSHVKDGSRSSTSGAILNSESKIIATCRAVYPQVNLLLSSALYSRRLSDVVVAREHPTVQRSLQRDIQLGRLKGLGDWKPSYFSFHVIEVQELSTV